MVDEPMDLVKVKCDSTEDLDVPDEQPRDLSCKRPSEQPKDLSLKARGFEPQTAPLDFSARALAPPPPLFFDLRTKLWQLGAAAGPLALPCWSNESSVCRRSDQKGSAGSAASESSKSHESSSQASQGAYPLFFLLPAFSLAVHSLFL
jgi:hypothetical protein